MAPLEGIASIWKNLQELDLRPIRESAEQDVAVAIVGSVGTGRHALAAQMRSAPDRPQATTQTPVMLVDLHSAEQAGHADLIVLMVNPGVDDHATEKAVAEKWTWAGKKVVVFYNEAAGTRDVQALPDRTLWAPARVIHGSVEDRHFLEDEFASIVIDLLPDRRLALGRRFPLFRMPIAHQLINETSVSNATYALGTGLAEIVPVLDLPLNLADMVVLTKGQALLVYKLGLALGLPREWQYYVTELGGVIGGGFLWRQAARSLIGLIPALGIIPKVAVSYAGTYVVGNVVLQWYLTGRHISRQQMQGLYRQAFAQGKIVAQRLARSVKPPRLRLPTLPKPKLLPARSKTTICKNCGASNDANAKYCQECGRPLSEEP